MQRWYNKFYQDKKEFYWDKKEWSQRTATERSRWSGMDHSADAVGHEANVTCHARKTIGHLSGHLTGHWTGITTSCSDWTSTCPSWYFHTTSLRTAMIHDELSFNTEHLDNWNHDSLVYCWRHLPPRSWTTTEISNCHPTTTTGQTTRVSIIHGTIQKKQDLKINCNSSPKWLCD